MLQNKVIGLRDNVFCLGASVDTADIIQVILPQLYGKYRSKTALEDGLDLGKMMMLEFKLGILDPVPGLLLLLETEHPNQTIIKSRPREKKIKEKNVHQHTWTLVFSTTSRTT
jgi:hypothetical protein